MTRQVIQRSLTALLMITVAAACGSDKAESGREIELTPAATDSVLGDQAPVAPAPSTAAPAPATPAPATKAPAASRPTSTAATTRTGTVTAGTTIPLAAAARVCTNTHRVGDTFTALTTADVAGSNGVSIPTGSEMTLELTEVARGDNSADRIKLVFRPVSIVVRGQAITLTADVTQVAKLDAVRIQSNTQQAGKVAAGAAVGAIAGQLLGRDTKSTVAGAAVGAAAGGAVAAAQTDYHGCLPANGAIVVTLTNEIRVRG